jgi:hypothetical protein
MLHHLILPRGITLSTLSRTAEELASVEADADVPPEHIGHSRGPSWLAAHA